jgi:ribonuclease R
MSVTSKKDPHIERESKKYTIPIPSREFILATLEEYGRPISRKHLIKLLDVGSENLQDALGYRLKAMLRDGQIMQDRRGRFCLLRRLTLIKGMVSGHPDGFGFVIPDEGGDDLFLTAKQMRQVMHGDMVLAYVSGQDRRGRLEGKIHEVIEHANKTVVGRFFSEHGVGFITADNKRITQDISVPIDFSMQAKSGQMVLAQIVAFPTKRNQAIAKVIEILGDHMAPGMEIDVAIHAHGIPSIWPEDILDSLDTIPSTVSECEVEGRVDLRELPFVTIDGEDAKDFDDAVFCKAKAKGGYQLYVAIADVSHYVAKDSALDKEAAKRGNSTYFPERVIPMLPEELSNGICSLNPNADRLCMVCELTISAKGRVSSSRFYQGVIHSKARLTYTQVAKWLASNKPDKGYKALFKHVKVLHDLYKVLSQARNQRGAIEFDTTETKIIFDENKKIDCIVPVIRNDAHRLIEECMLAANVATAGFLKKAKLPTLYRVHAPPTEEKLSSLREFLGELGLSLSGGKKPHPKDFKKLLEVIKDRPEKHLIESVMLRSLTQAQYVEANDGHFGLAYTAYTHFTSPIRRYPDLLIHRAINHAIKHSDGSDFSYSLDDMSKLGKHCSVTERRSDEATRQVVSWLKCEYLMDKLGQVFTGTIAHVTSFGIFVELNDIYVEGLVHVTSLKNDYYQFDAAKHRLRGERSGMVYRLGDTVSVQVARVDLDERKIDFELITEKDLDE